MSTLLVRHASVLATMDDDGTEYRDGGFFARDGRIEQVGPTSSLPDTADRVLDCRDRVVTPGLVNTHHHFYQTLTRTRGQQSELFGWLVELYPVWARIGPHHVRVATTTALAELALSGCTTAFDHHYLWPAGTSVDNQIEGAEQVPIRFHVARGSMSVGESEGGLPPDAVVEDEDEILADSQRVVEQFHDPEDGAMLRVVLAPCSPFSVSLELMRSTAELARELGVSMHTHLAETNDEEAYCLERFGLRPVPYAESVGWLGRDVWFAHAVHMSGMDLDVLAGSGTGVAHCPTSNMRLASGIAPLGGFLDRGVPVGLGVDGSASNDGSDMIAEARMALLVSRLARALERSSRPMIDARTILRVATRGGADVLGRSDIGAIEPGKMADAAIFHLDDITMAGVSDPIAGLVFCTPQRVDRLVVNGGVVVEEGELVGLDLPSHLAEHRRLADAL